MLVEAAGNAAVHKLLPKVVERIGDDLLMNLTPGHAERRMNWKPSSQLSVVFPMRRVSCVPPFGMALRALMARFKMVAVDKV